MSFPQPDPMRWVILLCIKITALTIWGIVFKIPKLFFKIVQVHYWYFPDTGKGNQHFWSSFLLLFLIYLSQSSDFPKISYTLLKKLLLNLTCTYINLFLFFLPMQDKTKSKELNGKGGTPLGERAEGAGKHNWWYWAGQGQGGGERLGH